MISRLSMACLVLLSACADLPGTWPWDQTMRDWEAAHNYGTCSEGEVSSHEGVEMVYISPCSFSMGSPVAEEGRGWDETKHEVTLSGGFYIGVYEVTQAQFEDLMGYENFDQPGYPGFPAGHASWYEAAAFANAVSDAAGLDRCFTCSGSGASITCSPDDEFATPYDCIGYRLPTEAEWELAARAGTTSAFNNGGSLEAGDEDDCDGDLPLDNGDLLDDIAVYCGNDLARPEEVGSRDPNPWGLYDMHGNVYEWCQDWSDDDGTLEATTDPWGPTSGSERMIRGGYFRAEPSDLRSANRNDLPPSTSETYYGFRLALSE